MDTVVMAQGTFDILHPGHIHYLEESLKLGDKLVVVLTTDSRTDKELVFSENERKEMVDAIEAVDNAVIGSEGDIYETLEEVDPDIITLGYDQDHSEDKVKKMAEEATGHKVKIERIEGKKDYSSSKIRSN